MKIRSIDVIGAGGTGSHFIPDAARIRAYHPDMMDATFAVWDGDHYEENNLLRQMCRKSDAEGKANKAEVMAMEVAPFGACSAHPEYIKGPEDLYDTLFHYLRAQKDETEPALSVFVLAVDNDATRKIIYDAIDEVPDLNVAIIDPANDYWTGHVNLWVRMDGNAPFLHPREKYEQLKSPTDRNPADKGCSKEVESTPQLITANKMAATLSLHILISLLSEESITEEVMFDLRLFTAGAIGEWVKSDKEGDN